MRSLAILWLVGLLAACSVSGIPDDGLTDTPVVGGRNTRLANGTICRVGLNGGPVVADRGIGGTGAPVVADRGIGGTGIVGVITGFASICVNGLEVRYDNSALVDINGITASAAALRVGQVVAIQARGSKTAPVATAISVRREVVGRIDSVELGSGLLTIAGQSVAVPAGTWGMSKIRLGDWVSVSGLRDPNGTLVATRLDAAARGNFTVHGHVVRDGGVTRVGGLTLGGIAGSALANGQSVTVSGHYTSGKAQAVTAEADALGSSPVDYFGPGVSHLVLEAFVRVTSGSVWLNGMKVDAAPGVNWTANTKGIAIVSLDRKPDGSLTAVGMRYTDARGFGSGSAKASAGTPRGDMSPSQQIRRGGLPTAPPADDTDAEPNMMPMSGLPNASTASASELTAAGSELSVPVAPVAAAASSVPAASSTPADGVRVNNLSAVSAPSTGDLISSAVPAANSSGVSASPTRSPAGGVPAVLVSGSPSASAASLVNVVTTPGMLTPVSSGHVMISAPKLDEIGTRGERLFLAGEARRGGR